MEESKQQNGRSDEKGERDLSITIEFQRNQEL
jgi:hypothetical protein